MSRLRTGRLSLKRALGISAGLHLLLAPLFVAALALFLDLGRTTENVRVISDLPSRVAWLSFEHRQRRLAVTAARPQPAPDRHVSIRAEQPAAAVRLTAAQRVVASQPFERRDAAMKAASAARVEPSARHAGTLALDRPIVEVAAAAQVHTPDQPVPASPSPALEQPASATVAQAAPAPVRGYEVPIGGWGQNFAKPLIADDAALADLRARFHALAAVSVQVDESGHAVKVVVPDSLPSDVRDEIERRLQTMRYVPAECNGLRCTGTLEITL